MTVVHAFQCMAQLHPERAALRCDGRVTTYRELDAASGRVALRLRARGVGPEALVALVLERSVEQVAAALGVMKAGGGFAPLDPAWPQGRLAEVVADSGAQLVVGRAAGRLGAAPTLDVADLVGADGSDEPAPPPQPPPRPEHLAYVIHTSGSTGRPKGVEITHANLMNFLRWRWRAMAITPEDRSSALASCAFDASIAEVWPHLTAGASVTLAPDEARHSPERLKTWLAAERITLATFVPPTLAEAMIRSPWPADTALRVLMSAGEALRARPRPGLPFVVMNGYGPTEGTVETTTAVVSPDPHAHTPPPIGRPIDGVEAHLLDEAGRPVAPGELGEIHVGGAGVARGYRNRPDLTAERFVPDPFSSRAGARLYRTGDLGRRLPDGQIAFHGRRDDQVKILGRRVEPGEVAAVLRRHPGVGSATVVARRADGRADQLLAYAAPARGERLDPAELRRFLAAELPAHMRPAHLLVLERLPLTANGKVDAAALPAPEGVADPLARDTAHFAAASTPNRGGSSPDPPHDPLEARLVRLWSEVLDGAAVAPDDDLFDRGADSLAALELLLQLEAEFGVRLTLGDLFQLSSVRGMATFLRATPAEPACASPRDRPRLIPLQPQGQRPPLIWMGVSAQSRALAQAVGSDQPVLGLTTDFDESPALRELETLPEISAYLADALLEAPPPGPFAIGGYSDYGVLAFEVARRLNAAGRPPQRLVMVDSFHHSPLGRWPAWRTQLLRIRHHMQSLARRSGRARLTYLWDKLRWAALSTRERLGRRRPPGFPDSATDFRAKLFGAAAAYDPAPFDGDVLFIQAEERWRATCDRVLWAKVTTGRFVGQVAPGTHADLARAPGVTAVGALIARYLRDPLDAQARDELRA